MRLESRLLFCVALTAATACRTDDAEKVPVDVSQKARVMPKHGKVWGTDLANGLALQSHELCQELGTIDCIDDAHLITLGGVEPGRLGIDAPLANASVSAPIAIERVALSACSLRWERDVAGPAVLFGPVLEYDNPQYRALVSTQLIQRLLSRQPTRDETDALELLYAELADLTDSPTRDWAIGACVVVATSTEALFY